MQGWRARIVEAVVRWLSWLGVIAYVPSLLLSVQARLWAVAIVDTAVYAGIIALHVYRHRIGYSVRARVLLMLFFTLGVFLIEVLGPFGAGPLWLFSFCVMSAVLFGMRGAKIAAALTFLTLAILGVRLGWGFLLPHSAGKEHTFVWLIVAANFVFLTTAVALSIAVILRGLEEEMLQREKAEAGLLQAQKMEAVGTLAGGIAHDLNNLLQPILMCGSLVEQALPAAHPARADVEVIISSVERASELVHRLLSFSRRSELVRVPVRVGDVLDETLTLLRSSLPHNVTVQVERRTEQDTVLADGTELQQVILNVCTNAVHAMRERGGVLTISLMAEGQLLHLTVVDEGTGMDAQTVERAFEPFFTTKQRGEGTGLGLAMVQRIMQMVGGSVTLSSRLGLGTTVDLSFPLLAGSVAAPAGSG